VAFGMYVTCRAPKRQKQRRSTHETERESCHHSVVHPKPQTAKEVIAANVKALIEQLEAGHSDALTAYLNAMSRFHNYSFGNILEIARQRAVT
jgi:hypothetical protein